MEEFERSHHASAAEFIGSLDNVLGEVVEGRLAAVNGCWQCHGSTLAFLKSADGSVQKSAIGAPVLDPSTWPNTGIGRLNPDGSSGACSACHSRHTFSKAMARQPEVCGKCHLGPDHPQAEIYEVTEKGTWLKITVLLINIAAVLYLLLSKRLFGLRGGHRAYEESLHELSLLEVQESAEPPTGQPVAP